MDMYVFHRGSSLEWVKMRQQIYKGATYHFEAKSPIFVVADFINEDPEQGASFKFSFKRVDYNFNSYKDDDVEEPWFFPDGYVHPDSEGSAAAIVISILIPFTLVCAGLIVVYYFMFYRKRNQFEALSDADTEPKSYPMGKNPISRLFYRKTKFRDAI